MKTALFDYQLPDELIARFPLKQREQSRLLLLDRKSSRRRHLSFFDLPDVLHRGDLLVLNDTRVIPARLFANRESTGARVEVFLLEELALLPFEQWRREPEASALVSSGLCKADTSYVSRWRVLLRPASKVKPLERYLFLKNENPSEDFFCIAPKQQGNTVEREIWLFGREPIRQLVERFGEMPLPPYLKRSAIMQDREDYQTVYAAHPGAIAAPTAGLHLSRALLERLGEKGVETTALTLHVGYGTFKPVETDDIHDHHLHTEKVLLSAEAAEKIEQAKSESRRVIACGTTVVRALESRALQLGKLKPGQWSTDIFIYPPYTFRVIDGLITNFHLPRSTLLMLVSAWAGRENILSAYQEAIEKKYRFYSYGDGMLII